MGKVLFINTNRVNGVAGILVCLVAAGMGLFAVFNGKYAGIVIVPLAVYCGKFCLKMATQTAVLYEQGFICKNIFETLAGRYADLKAITRGAVSRNGVLQTNINLVMQSGKRVTISNERFLKGDDKMELLLDHACRALAQTWASTVKRENQVVWLSRGDKPLLTIRKEGVLIDGKTGDAGFIAFAQLRCKPAYGLDVDICNGDKKILTVSSAEPNYFVGPTLIEMLGNQKAIAATARG